MSSASEAQLSNSPLTIEEIVSWFRSKEHTLRRVGVMLANVHESRIHLPSAFADFDTDQAIGRISAWVNGYVDFEVLRRSDSKDVFFRNVRVTNINERVLESAYAAFLCKMLDPNSVEPKSSSVI